MSSVIPSNNWVSSYHSITIILICISKLPRIISKETPFLRSKEELNYLHPEGGPPPARFMGVTRIFEKNTGSTMTPNGKFGVEIPLLLYKGRKVVLRDFDREDVAGMVFVFLYRVLFGAKATRDVEVVVNCQRGFVDDTLYAFGVGDSRVSA